MALGEGLGARGLLREYERHHWGGDFGQGSDLTAAAGDTERAGRYSPLPAASLGAIWPHFLHSLDEHGISWRRYTSRTIFWTLPFLVDRTKILLEMLLAKKS